MPNLLFTCMTLFAYEADIEQLRANERFFVQI